MSKNTLVFDTETSGFKESRLLQLAYQVYSPERELIKEYETCIKPVDFQIEQGAQDVHGISRGRAMSDGVVIRTAIVELLKDLAACNTLVAHNLKFDQKVIRGELERLKVLDFKKAQKDLNGLPKSEFFDLIRSVSKVKQQGICTMATTTDLCKIPHATWNSYKWPKLTELHQFLFNESFDGAHDALIDVKACARCYFELLDINVLTAPNKPLK